VDFGSKTAGQRLLLPSTPIRGAVEYSLLSPMHESRSSLMEEFSAYCCFRFTP
jgi:hypothetical protein